MIDGLLCYMVRHDAPYFRTGSMLQPLGQTVLWATQSYDVTKIWYATMLVAAALPPLVRYLYRHHWQFTLRQLFLATAVVVVMLSCIRSDLESFSMYYSNYQTSQVHLTYPADWSYALPVLIFSGVITWAVTRSPYEDERRNAEDGQDSP
jgi:hypothetical protein